MQWRARDGPRNSRTKWNSRKLNSVRFSRVQCWLCANRRFDRNEFRQSSTKITKKKIREEKWRCSIPSDYTIGIVLQRPVAGTSPRTRQSGRISCYSFAKFFEKENDQKSLIAVRMIERSDGFRFESRANRRRMTAAVVVFCRMKLIYVGNGIVPFSIFGNGFSLG